MKPCIYSFATIIAVLLVAFTTDTQAQCPAPASITISNLDASSAKITWPSSTGANNYSIHISTNPTPPGNAAVSMNTSYSVNGLNCGTKYYVFVSANCGSSGTSAWTMDSFTTDVCCVEPTNVSATASSYNRGNVNWTASPDAISYEYHIDTSPATPTGGTSVTYTSVLFQNIDPGTTYYVCVRSVCNGSIGYSQWVCDTMNTPQSVSAVSKDDGIMTLSPNPAKDILNITVERFNTDSRIIVVNMLGETVLQQQVTTGSIALDIHDLPSGLYTLLYSNSMVNAAARFLKE